MLLFQLECTSGRVVLRESCGFSTAELNGIASDLKPHQAVLCKEWERIHGDH